MVELPFLFCKVSSLLLTVAEFVLLVCAGKSFSLFPLQEASFITNPAFIFCGHHMCSNLPWFDALSKVGGGSRRCNQPQYGTYVL